MVYIDNNLYNNIINTNAPVATDLHIISGYASYQMLERLLAEFPSLKIQLYIGMTHTDGISRTNHNGFLHLMELYSTRLTVMYQHTSPSTHIKLYTWLYDGISMRNYIGSANFSENGFCKLNELMVESGENFEYLFASQKKNSITCTDPAVSVKINIYDEELDTRDNKHFEVVEETLTPYPRTEESIVFSQSKPSKWFMNQRALINNRFSSQYDIIDIPIIFKGQYIFSRRGINNIFRNGQDSYLEQSNRYPFTRIFPYDTTLTFFTDDNEILEGVFKEQYDGRLYFQSDIYTYFAKRLNLDSKRPIEYSDLEQYGRTSIKISKIHDAEYLLDFSIEA